MVSDSSLKTQVGGGKIMMKKRSGDRLLIIYTSHTITGAVITKKCIICMWNSAVSQECHQVVSHFMKLSCPVVRHCEVIVKCRECEE